MSQKETIIRNQLIIKKLRKHPATFRQIADYLDMESDLQGYNFTISKRTFLRDKDAILSTYGINIQYDTSEKVYFIDEEDQPDAKERMLEAFDTFHALNLSDRLSKHIHFEKRKPKGTENLYDILQAIENKLEIRFYYKKFWEDEGRIRAVRPYALKEFRNRWYLLSFEMESDKVKTFALDRLSVLKVTRTKFESDKNFDANEYYRHSFGIIRLQDQKPVAIVLSFDSIQGKYIKSLPLHESQKVLMDTAEELQISLRMYITHDFMMELLSYGDSVKVLSPKSLVDEMKGRYEAMLGKYR